MEKKPVIFGSSRICVPMDNVLSEDYQAKKAKRNSDKEFKQLIRMHYNPKTKRLTVSCIYKRKAVLDRFLGNSNYP